jgi:hypothetical protein
MCKILANMTQVRDVAPGPLVFCCNIGVRQGENLSPFLFSIYVNDLEEFLTEKKCCWITKY